MATSLFLHLRLAASYRWIGHMALDGAIKTYLRSVPVGTTHTTFAMISRCNDKWAVSTLPTSQTAKWSSIKDVQNHATWAGYSVYVGVAMRVTEHSWKELGVWKPEASEHVIELSLGEGGTLWVPTPWTSSCYSHWTKWLAS